MVDEMADATADPTVDATVDETRQREAFGLESAAPLLDRTSCTA